MVSAPTPRCFLISRWIASIDARTGLRLRPVRVLSESSPWVANSRLVATSAEPFKRRKGSSCSLRRMRAGNRERSWRSGSMFSRVVYERPYSLANHCKTSSSLCTACFARARASASAAESCFSDTIRSSNGFEGESWVKVSLMAETASFSPDRSFSSVIQTERLAPPVGR